MLLRVANLNKQIGHKELFDSLSFILEEGTKTALIGRNGLGKSTLFKILNGEDKDFTGQIELKKNLKLVLTRQEHFFDDEHGIAVNKTVLDYILDDVPQYRELQQKIETYSSTLTDDESIELYSDAVSDFSHLGYYDIEDKIILDLENFGVSMEKALGPLKVLSGGEKRFVELTRVMYSRADLALIDEPTNHMDYIGKENFIKWLKSTKQNVFVVTHDRDVLKYVDRILEIKDKKVASFTGNYDAYIKQNSLNTVSSITNYEVTQRKLELLEKQIKQAAKKKAFGGAPKVLYEKLMREYTLLKEQVVKPSFWIDQSSKDQISDKVMESYEKYKDKNIKIRTHANSEHKKELLKVSDLSLGYTAPLFKNISFAVHHGDRLFIKGRNGAGKTSLTKAIIDKVNNDDFMHGISIYSGEIKFNQYLRIGVYEQEIDPKYLSNTLFEGVMNLYNDQKLDITVNQVNGLLSQYLFNPIEDGKLRISHLSGGQKARFQLIKMLSNKPNLLILDEPTNHLDLPSVEELENSLGEYEGAILYISHDSYFINNMGGDVVEITR